MSLVPADDLRAVVAGILAKSGASAADAALVAESLVLSNLLGHDSHGVRRIPSYLDDVRAGRIEPTARPASERTRPGTLVVHGHRAFGQVSATQAVRGLLDVVDDNGTGVAAIRECNHVGRLGEYVAALAEHGLMGLAFGNADPTVAPHGGIRRRFGTNPLAWAVPRGEDQPPLVMDWATAATAEGKLALARDRGESVAPGLVIDHAGRPTTRPEDFYAGGALLPFGGHKGYGLSLLIEIVGGLLTGAGIGSMPGYSGGFGTVLVAVHIGAFTDARRFRADTEAFCQELTAEAAAEGHDEVLVPGLPEQRTKEIRTREGIPLGQSIWDELRRLAVPQTALPEVNAKE